MMRRQMTITIRRAELRDRDSLGRLGVALMRTHHNFDPLRFLAPMDGAERGYASWLLGISRNDEGIVFVAADDHDNVLGYVAATLEDISWIDLRGACGYIHDVIVDEPARRNGIATKLLTAALEWLREHHAPRVVLSTAAPNIAAQTFFAKFGFRNTMVEMTKEL